MKPRRKQIARLGRRGSIVLVVEAENHSAPCYAVEYRSQGKRRRAIFARSRAGRVEAMAFAEGVLSAQNPAPEGEKRLTLEQLYQAFAAEEYPALRSNTQRLYRENWRMFEAVAGAHTLADDVGMETCRRVRRDLEARKLAVNTIAKVFHTVRRVYRWAEEHEAVERARPLRYRYKVAKEQRPEQPPEYRTEEFHAILAQVPLEKRTSWRAHVALALCGYQGARQHAVLHLKWQDVDFAKGEITWRAEWDKVGREWTQPMREPTRRVLERARQWNPDGEWVLPKGSSKGSGPTYTIQSLWAQLRTAEKAAGIERKAGRAGHGLRRMLAGDVTAATNNPVLGLHAIGDRDLKQATRYIQHRDDQIRDAFGTLDDTESVSE